MSLLGPGGHRRSHRFLFFFFFVFFVLFFPRFFFFFFFVFMCISYIYIYIILLIFFRRGEACHFGKSGVFACRFFLGGGGRGLFQSLPDLGEAVTSLVCAWRMGFA